MKKCIFSIVIALVLLGVSCKSSAPPAPAELAPTPAPTQEPAPAPVMPAQPAGPSQASLDAYNQAKAKADAARKRASDFESPSYFPSDWETVEGQYNSAGSLPKSTDSELQQAAAAYNASAEAYDSLFEKTIPLYAQAWEDEIIAARDVVIATGLVPDFPEYLQNADSIALDALAKYEAKDYYAALDSAQKALTEYQALKIAADIYLVRQEILDRDFVRYDSENFNKADDTALAAYDAYNAGDIQAAADGAEEAQLRYNLVLSTAWAAYAADRRNSAAVERKKALDIKANIAVRDAFREAESVYTQAESGFRSETYEDASILYIESEARFVIVRQDAEEKRRIAEETMKEAEEKIGESDETAKKAEIIIGGTL
jgi:hypothetical protein